ncbi:MAG: type IV toxin-antitoxin system AbiEi family antitoxin domain-containing protein [Deltaproteobacteria bacterium]|nr:type IV toxin-antitoxin system AbiEi family antitoxin domain-containing protein [Deltaproteobacteria bacterium]
MTKGQKQTKPVTEILKGLGIFRTGDAIAAGVSQPTLSRLAASGTITRLEYGLYSHPAADLDLSELDFAIACARLGAQSVIGGLTALFRHGLITQVPDRIWVMVPPSVRSTRKLYRILRTANDPNVGIEDHKTYRITGIERSVIEALQYATKIGLQTAISATRRAIAEGLTTEKKLYAMAKKLDAENAFTKHWEAIVAE